MRRRRLRESRGWLERYAAGDCEQVWAELDALGPGVRLLDYFDDALQLGRETMRRVRANCETLIPRLESLGWCFEADRSVLGTPLPSPILDAMENRYGSMPVALRAFYEIVGEVNFGGTPFKRAGWPGLKDGLDPLSVAGASDIDDAEVPLTQTGRELTMHIGTPGADAPLYFEGEVVYVADCKLTLVRYLRYAMVGGGCLAFMPGSMWLQRPEDDLRVLTDGLLPI